MHFLLLALALAVPPKHPPTHTPGVERCRPACTDGQRCVGNMCVAQARPKPPIKPTDTKPAPTK